MMSSGPILIGTGPLVAYLVSRDANHAWVRRQLAESRASLLTCDVVLTEACHLIRRAGSDPMDVLRLVSRGALDTSFRLSLAMASVIESMERYTDQPMSLADACLVRMAELDPRAVVLTLDGDFRRYRTRRGRPLRL
jgi:predicted nucleic acid-binding protein